MNTRKSKTEQIYTTHVVWSEWIWLKDIWVSAYIKWDFTAYDKKLWILLDYVLVFFLSFEPGQKEHDSKNEHWWTDHDMAILC